MSRPVIGILGNSHEIDGRYPVRGGGDMCSDAVANAAGCLPLIVPADPAFVTVGELAAERASRRIWR